MKTRSMVAIAFFLLATAAMGADTEVEALLARMRQAYSSTKTARLTVKISGSLFGKETLTSDLTYMKERKIHAKLSGGRSIKGTRLFISDGEKVTFNDFSGNAVLANFDLDLIPIPVNLESMSFWDWKRQLSTADGSNMEDSKFRLRKNVSWNGKSWLVLEETAYGQDVYVEYYIDPKTSLIYRVLVYDLKKTDLRRECVVTKLQRDVKVDANLFKIKVKPKPATVSGGKIVG